MKKWRGLQTERDNVQDTLSEVGAVLSEPFHNRVKELIVKLSKFKGVKIESLVMGMGSYWLHGEVPFKEIWKGQVEEGVHEIDLGDFCTSKKIWAEHYEAANPGICEVATELDELLMYITDDRYIQLMGITEKEMKKLLSKA